MTVLLAEQPTWLAMNELHESQVALWVMDRFQPLIDELWHAMSDYMRPVATKVSRSRMPPTIACRLTTDAPG